MNKHKRSMADAFYFISFGLSVGFALAGIAAMIGTLPWVLVFFGSLGITLLLWWSPFHPNGGY